MPIMFNTILREARLPLRDVRLLRHKDTRATTKITPYELWQADREKFDLYQSHQPIKGRARFLSSVKKRGYWASFVGTSDNRTLFVGIYAVKYQGILRQDIPMPHTHVVDKARSCDVYNLKTIEAFSDLEGKLFIEWGPGPKAWVQRADKRDKQITELHAKFKEREFPGFLNFREPLSGFDKLPQGWIVALQSSRVIYLLTCPRTKEQYVGSATGEGGFWQRLQDYVRTGHGGNIALKSRDPSDYQISILEVAGSACSRDDILKMERQWIGKLHSKEIGLNRI